MSFKTYYSKNLLFEKKSSVLYHCTTFDAYKLYQKNGFFVTNFELLGTKCKKPEVVFVIDKSKLDKNLMKKDIYNGNIKDAIEDIIHYKGKKEESLLKNK